MRERSSRAVRLLLEAFALEPAGPDEFQGRSPGETGRRSLYGGTVAAQALIAAGRTAPAERHPHALHANFLRLGDPAEPVRYAVERLFDGRSFSARRVVARQRDRIIFQCSASFQAPEDGAIGHQVAMPDVPAAEGVPRWNGDLPTGEHPGGRARSGRADEPRPMGPTFEDLPDPSRAAHPAGWGLPSDPFDIRGLGAVARPADPAAPALTGWRIWLRTESTLPDAALLHAATLVFASDLTLLDTALFAHGMGFGPAVRGASLDHAVWLHRRFRADDWLLLDQESPSAAGGRGYSRGHVFSREGLLVASLAQEGVLRVLR